LKNKFFTVKVEGMARPLRIEYPGAVYHVTTRGNARGEIFSSDDDRHKFLAILAETGERYNWLCHAYCLMDNHYHLVVETPDPNLSLGMRQLNGVYTQAFNRARNWLGHLFQGRYKAIVVEKESYLLELCRYVVLNPVRAGMVSSPEQWPWSSYAATAYPTEVPPFLTVAWLLAQFAGDIPTARQRYRQYVRDGMQQQGRPWQKLVGQVFLGSEPFVARMGEVFETKRDIREIPRSQRHPGRPPLSQLFSGHQDVGKERRNRLIAEAHVMYAYNLKEIGDFLGIHYTTVSKIVSRNRKK
jgi:putative transposase